MLFKLFFVACVGVLTTNVFSFNPPLTYTVRIKKITTAPNISVQYTIDQHRDKQFYVNANFTISSEPTTNKVIVVFDRCDPEGIDCEYFQSWTLTDICPKLRDPDQIWSKWYGSYDPPMVCPIKHPRYQVRNGTLDASQAIRWYPDVTNYYWKVKQTMYADDVFVGAYTIELTVFGYRKRSNNVTAG